MRLWSTSWRWTWRHEQGALIFLSVLSLAFITIYSSSSTPWLSQEWSEPPPVQPNHTRHNRTISSVSVYDPFISSLINAPPTEALFLNPSLEWIVTTWHYCITIYGIDNNSTTTTSCYPWKDVCAVHRTDMCQRIASMQSLSFVSLLMSMMALYSAYRAVAEDSFVMPLWSMGCRALQITLEVGLVMLAKKMQSPTEVFPRGLAISTGVFVCCAHMCIVLLAFSSALHVFLRLQRPPRPSFVLFPTAHEVA